MEMDGWYGKKSDWDKYTYFFFLITINIKYIWRGQSHAQNL
jgi:hypothetical protein